MLACGESPAWTWLRLELSCQLLLKPESNKCLFPEVSWKEAPWWDHGSLWVAGDGVLERAGGCQAHQILLQELGSVSASRKNRTGGFPPSPPRAGPPPLLSGLPQGQVTPQLHPRSSRHFSNHNKTTPRKTRPPNPFLAAESGSLRASQMFCFQKLNVRTWKFN